MDNRNEITIVTVAGQQTGKLIELQKLQKTYDLANMKVISHNTKLSKTMYMLRFTIVAESQIVGYLAYDPIGIVMYYDNGELVTAN